MDRSFLKDHKLKPQLKQEYSEPSDLFGLVIYFEHSNKSKTWCTIYYFDPFKKGSTFDMYNNSGRSIKDLCETHQADALFLPEKETSSIDKEFEKDIEDLAKKYYENVYMKIERKPTELKV